MPRTLLLPVVIVSLFTITGAAHADGLENCTSEPTEKWKSIEEITKMATDQGLVVSKAQVEGSCYELYAQDKEGKLWEMFHNPVDGKLVDKEAKGS